MRAAHSEKYNDFSIELSQVSYMSKKRNGFDSTSPKIARTSSLDLDETKSFSDSSELESCCKTEPNYDLEETKSISDFSESENCCKTEQTPDSQESSSSSNSCDSDKRNSNSSHSDSRKSSSESPQSENCCKTEQIPDSQESSSGLSPCDTDRSKSSSETFPNLVIYSPKSCTFVKFNVNNNDHCIKSNDIKRLFSARVALSRLLSETLARVSN